jgi:DnaJ family protein B protein 4
MFYYTPPCLTSFLQKPHPLFTRDKDDIYHELMLDLVESLCGWKRTVTTIDGKHIGIERAGPTQPGSSDIYPDLGMPNPKNSLQRGNFVIKYAVRYPTSLTKEQKVSLREVLMNPNWSRGNLAH